MLRLYNATFETPLPVLASLAMWQNGPILMGLYLPAAAWCNYEIVRGRHPFINCGMWQLEGRAGCV